MQTSAFYSEVVHRDRVLENQSRLETLPPRLGGSVHPRGPRSCRLGHPHGGTVSSDSGHFPARHKRRYFPGLWGPVQAWHPVHSARTSPTPAADAGPQAERSCGNSQRGRGSVASGCGLAMEAEAVCTHACPLHRGGVPPRSCDPRLVLVTDLPRLPTVGLGGQGCFSALPGHQEAPSCVTRSFPAMPTCVQPAQKTGAPPPLPCGRQDTAGKGCAFGPRRLRSTGAPGPQWPQANPGESISITERLWAPTCFSQTAGDPTAAEQDASWGSRRLRGATARGLGSGRVRLPLWWVTGGSHVPAALTGPAARSRAGLGLLSL